jgi:hypothetical protein
MDAVSAQKLTILRAMSGVLEAGSAGIAIIQGERERRNAGERARTRVWPPGRSLTPYLPLPRSHLQATWA